MICTHKILPYSSFEACRADYNYPEHLAVLNNGALAHVLFLGSFHEQMLARQNNEWIWAEKIAFNEEDELGASYKTIDGEIYYAWMLLDTNRLDDPVDMPAFDDTLPEYVMGDVHAPVSKTVIFVKTIEEVLEEFGHDRLNGVTNLNVNSDDNIWNIRQTDESIGLALYNNSMYEDGPIPVTKATSVDKTVYIRTESNHERVVYEHWMIKDVREVNLDGSVKMSGGLFIIKTYDYYYMRKLGSEDLNLSRSGSRSDWSYEYPNIPTREFCYRTDMYKPNPFLAQIIMGKYHPLRNDDTPDIAITYEPWMLKEIIPFHKGVEVSEEYMEYQGYLVVSPEIESSAFKRRSFGILKDEPKKIKDMDKLIHLHGDGTWEVL